MYSLSHVLLCKSLNVHMAGYCPVWTTFLCLTVISMRNPCRWGGDSDGPSLCRSTPHIGKCLVTFSNLCPVHNSSTSSHYNSNNEMHLHVFLNVPRWGVATPIQKLVEVGTWSYSYLFLQRLAHSKQSINVYWTDKWMALCLNSEYRKKFIHSQNTYSCSLKIMYWVFTTCQAGN